MSYSQSHSQCQVVNWTDAVNKVREQVELECFTSDEKPLAEEMIKIIAEIYTLDNGCEVKIAGKSLPAKTVKEIYGELKIENVRSVMINYQAVDYSIRSPKSYIRTALYNSVFESESKIINDLKTAGLI